MASYYVEFNNEKHMLPAMSLAGAKTSATAVLRNNFSGGKVGGAAILYEEKIPVFCKKRQRYPWGVMWDAEWKALPEKKRAEK